ncbi:MULTISPECIES: dihydrolipoamide acetyltransferase family protein [Inquilinus]|uniref:Dihydrolipoamide acetyltransferase component of pyruvate dehydrogenase complex n=1 Tax=Inquilinus ginsengisoli TaxID=363840 RepID=A0ABU1K0P2_9PROT|nr:dihydrolipoamide acetyltransferase family protein [Inquilinus ginsengisoli]MDR6294445.1 2-oxoglutarate dehydrogenase E2 component (dihydrolipoamide succinyltransferase) [Inquilinus ginsengisoli]
MADTIEVTGVDVLAPIQQEGTKAAVRSWFAAVGDTVREGDPLVELETDKVAVEVPAPASGVLTEILIPADQDATPGAVLGRIGAGAGEARSSLVPPPLAGGGQGEGVVDDSHPHPPIPDRTSGQFLSGSGGGNPLPLAPSREGRGDAKVADRSIADFDPALRLSPSVRKLLAETGLDPAGLTGSGKDGRLTRQDVEQEVARRRAPVETPVETSAPAAPPLRTSAPGGSRLIQHDGMRRRIAEHMAHSLATAPHVTAVFEADFTAVLAHRTASRAAFERQGVALTVTAYIVQACVAAMQAVPVVNSRWHADALEVFDDINIGIGTALGDKGLVVPVVHRAQALSLLGTAGRLQETTALARAGKLAPADVQGGTFTISNHGVSGSLLAAPIIINQPQTAILGIGKVEKRVVVREVAGSDAMLIRPMAYVSLSIDHRALDGAQTNAWLTRFVAALEDWPPIS